MKKLIVRCLALALMVVAVFVIRPLAVRAAALAQWADAGKGLVYMAAEGDPDPNEPDDGSE